MRIARILAPPPPRSLLRRRAAFVGLLAAALLLSLLPPSYAQTQAVDVTLLATNDFHGRLKTPGLSLLPEGGDEAVPVGGAAYLSAHLDAARAANPNSLWVDAGDLVGATPVLSNLFLDEPTVRVANLMGLEVQTVGNHEFDRGRDEILRRMQGGCHPDEGCFDPEDSPYGEFEGQDFATLSTNVVTEEGNTLAEPWWVEEVGGAQIGFIGVVTQETPTIVSPAGVEGLEFLPEAEAVNATVPLLEAQNVDAIVVLLHEGGRQDGTYNECENFQGAAPGIVSQLDDAVDVVISGHTHEAYVCEDYEGKLVTSAYQYGAMFTEIDLSIVPGEGVVESSAVNHLVTQDVEPDAEVQALIDYYDALAGPALQEVVGTSTVEIPRTTRSEESRQGNLATDALRQQYAQYDIDFAFQNSGGLRADLTRPDDVDDDGNYNIRREYVLDVWPFGNTVWLAEINGQQLLDVLENGVQEIGGGRFIQLSGLRIEYSIADESGEFPRGEIEAVEYWDHPDHPDGTPVDLSADATYRVAMNDFMMQGGDSYPVFDDEVFLFDEGLEVAIERYLMEVSPVSPEVEGRIVEVEPSEDADLTRVFGRDRVETAIAISQATFADAEAGEGLAAGTVVLAHSTGYADALAGTPLAVAVDAPILLTPTTDLDPRVLEEIQRILPEGGLVHLLGGEAALSPSVVTALEAEGYEIERIAGATRIETALAIAEQLDADTALVTTGYDFPDALAAGAAAAAQDAAVVLTTSDAPHPAVDAYLGEDIEAFAIGGPAVRAYPDATAVSGPTREETAVEVAEAFFDAPTHVAVARRDTYADALAGGAHIGRLGGPLLLTPTDDLHPAPQAYLCAGGAGIDAGFVYGGDAALSEAAFDAVAGALTGEGCPTD